MLKHFTLKNSTGVHVSESKVNGIREYVISLASSFVTEPFYALNPFQFTARIQAAITGTGTLTLQWCETGAAADFEDEVKEDDSTVVSFTISSATDAYRYRNLLAKTSGYWRLKYDKIDSTAGSIRLTINTKGL